MDVRDSLELSFKVSNILGTGLYRHTLSLLIAFCDRSANPEALAAIVRELSSPPPPDPVTAPPPPSPPAPIHGFDEYMNLVLDDADELNVKKKTKKPLGRNLLKGDNITLMMNTGK